MRGLDYIADMRRKGFRPGTITLTDKPYQQETLPLWLQYEASDTPELHDLRALIGLFVSVMGTDRGIVDRWAEACIKAGAHTVLTMVYTPGREESGRWQEKRLYGVNQ